MDNPPYAATKAASQNNDFTAHLRAPTEGYMNAAQRLAVEDRLRRENYIAAKKKASKK